MTDLIQGGRVGLVAALTVILYALSSAPVAPQTAAPTKRQRDAVHFTDALKTDDAKLADTFDGAVESLQAGHDVVILFDGRSVTALRINLKKAKKTPLEEMAIAPPEQVTLAKRLGLHASQGPRNQFEFVQRLAEAGARVFVNRDAVRLYGLGDGEIHPVATLISSRQMGRLLDETDLCYTYGH